MNKKQQQNEMGKGIEILLGNISKIKDNHSSTVAESNRLNISLIDFLPNQPRKDFDEKSLQELAQSIKLHDLIQPITVKKLTNGRFQLISGERRLRASKIAGLKDIPAYIREINDNSILELALIENIQREDLNPIEIALSYNRLLDELSYTQEKLAERMGQDRTTISHYIRLLKLPPDIQQAVREKLISMGHARNLISIDETEKLLYAFKQIVSQSLNVRQTEALVKKINTKEKSKIITKVKQEIQLNPTFKKMEDTLSSKYETKVKLNHNKNGSGFIEFTYSNLSELNKIIDKFLIK